MRGWGQGAGPRGRHQAKHDAMGQWLSAFSRTQRYVTCLGQEREGTRPGAIKHTDTDWKQNSIAR